MAVNIENAQQEMPVPANEMDFYVVSLKKFLILFISTLGTYSVYWFFKHWSLYRKSANEEMWPVMRAIFSIFFIHSLFSLFELKYKKKTGEAPKSIINLATIYVVFTIVCQICSQLSESGYGDPLTFIVSLLILPISAWVLYQGQSLANYAGEDVLGQTNDQLTGLNYLWVVIGVIVWVLVLLGIYAQNSVQ